MRPDFRPAIALEQDAAHGAQEMRVGQHLADPLRPHWHAAERKMEGSRKNTAICSAWSWVWANVEKLNPTARLAAMKMTMATASRRNEPSIGTPNTSAARMSTSETCKLPTSRNGTILPTIT